MSLTGVNSSNSLAAYLLQLYKNSSSSNVTAAASSSSSSSDGQSSNAIDASGSPATIALDAILAALSAQSSSSSSSSSDQNSSNSSSAQRMSALTGSGPTASNIDQFVKDLTGLLKDVQSGDVTSAKQAANAVSQDLAAITPASVGANSQGGSSTGPLSTVMTDLGDLVTAAQSGDTAGASSASTALQKDPATLFSSLGASGSTETASSSSTSDASTDASSTSASNAANTTFEAEMKQLLAAFAQAQAASS